MVVLINCTGSCAHQGGVVCKPEFLGQGCSWNQQGHPLPRDGKHWTNWDGQKWRLPLSDTAVLTFRVVLNSHWDSLYHKKRSDFLLVRLCSHRARQWELLWARHRFQPAATKAKGISNTYFDDFFFFNVQILWSCFTYFRVWIGPTSYERQCHWAKVRDNCIL